MNRVGAQKQMDRLEGKQDRRLARMEIMLKTNLDRVAANAARQRRRNDREEGVSEDEELLTDVPQLSEDEEEDELEPTQQGANPSGEGTHIVDADPEIDGSSSITLSRNAGEQMTEEEEALFAELLQRKRKREEEADAAHAKKKAALSEKAKDSCLGDDAPAWSREVEAGRGNLLSGNRAAPNALLGTHLRQGFHLPLTLCTSDAVARAARDPAVLTLKKHPMPMNQGTIRVLDTACWPGEADLSKETWRDAYKNFLKVVAKIATAEIVDRFREHFEYLEDSDDIKADFRAVLAFDIEIRQRYVTEKKEFVVGSRAYENLLARTRTDRNTKMLEQQSSGFGIARGPIERGGRENRAHGEQRGATGKADEGSHSFRGGSDGASSFRGGQSFRGDKREPSCLRCARPGHKAQSCTQITTASGGRVFAVWHNGKLVAEDNRDQAMSRA